MNSTYEGPDGVRGLTLRLDMAPGDGVDEQVSPRARVASVMFYSTSAETTTRLEERIRAVLGLPTVACYTGGMRTRIETRYWPGENGRGILFLVFRDSLPDSLPDPLRAVPFELGWGIVEFGAEPVSAQYVTFEPCD